MSADLEQWYANGRRKLPLLVIGEKSSLLDEHLEFFASLPRWHEAETYLFISCRESRPGIPLDQQSPQDLIWIREPYILGYDGPRDIVTGHTPTQYLGRYEFFPDVTGLF